MITALATNEVFVFGSNLAGAHYGGAARQSWQQFGARIGDGEGLTGQCYAFPTLDGELAQLPFSRLEQARDRLYESCRQNPDWRFLLTKVGCGIAGYDEAQIRGLFADPPANLVLPEDWRR